MSLQQELGLMKPFANHYHEALLNIVITGSILSKEGQNVLHPFGLTDAQFNILMMLKYQTADGRMNQTELGNKLLVNRSNVTGLIDRMERAGLVRRIANTEDRRVNYVEVTDEGINVLKKANKAYIERVEDIMSVLSDADYSKLCKILGTVRERLRVS